MDPELKKLLDELKTGVKDVPTALGKLVDLEKKIQELEAQGKSVEQLRKDLDKVTQDLMAVQKRSIGSPIIDRSIMLPGGRPLMRFSSTGLARDFAEFCKGIKSHDKALSANDDSTGGYTIPENLAAEIDVMVQAAGIMGRICNPLPLPAGIYHTNRRLSGAAMHWKTAGAEAVSSTPEFGRLSLTAKTLIALIDSDVEFDEDTNINVGNFLATEFAYGMGNEEDRVTMVGAGLATDGEITGILNSDRVTVITMANTKDAFDDMTYDNLVDVEEAVWDGVIEPQFLLSRTVRGLVRKLKDDDKRPIWIQGGGGEPPEIMGYPYTLSANMPGTAVSAASTGFLAFGDFRKGIKFGRRGQLRIDFSAIPGFRNLQNCWRAFERLDIKVNGFTAAEIAAHKELANPIVVLKTGQAAA